MLPPSPSPLTDREISIEEGQLQEVQFLLSFGRWAPWTVRILKFPRGQVGNKIVESTNMKKSKEWM